MAKADRHSLLTAGPAESRAGDESALEGSILLLSVLAWMGATISLLLLRSDSGIHGLLCPARTGCDAVLTSRFAAILGIPLPWFGVAFYTTGMLLLLLAYGTRSHHFRLRSIGVLLRLAVVGASFSAVLMIIQFGVLRAFCPLCTASAVIAICLAVASARAERLVEASDFHGRRAGALAIAAFALLSAVPHLIPATSAQSGVLAIVDGQTFTRAQMEEELGASLQTLQRSVFALESEWVRGKVEGALLAAEASKENKLPIPAGDLERRQHLEELMTKHRVEVFLRPPEINALNIDLTTARTSGPADAKVQLVVFSDFECRHCADLSSVLKRIRKDFSSTVLIAYRYFPIEMHARAFPAAVAAECASEQGAFWEYHDKLYERAGDLSEAAFVSIARELRLDEAKFLECRKSSRPQAVVEASRADADASGLEGVPALFLNGKRIRGRIDYENLSEKIRAALGAFSPAAEGAQKTAGPP